MILQPPSKEFIKVERSFGRSPEVYGRHVHNGPEVARQPTLNIGMA